MQQPCERDRCHVIDVHHKFDTQGSVVNFPLPFLCDTCTAAAFVWHYTSLEVVVFLAHGLQEAQIKPDAEVVYRSRVEEESENTLPSAVDRRCTLMAGPGTACCPCLLSCLRYKYYRAEDVSKRRGEDTLPFAVGRRCTVMAGPGMACYVFLRIRLPGLLFHPSCLFAYKYNRGRVVCLWTRLVR
ncbi:unnamed protein product [Ascophyllum nodosum]